MQIATMKRLKYIFIFLALLVWKNGVVAAQDNARMAEKTIMGTARYVGMAGAMTAIGGDPSAALDNPAGLGLYRRSELMLTVDYAYDLTCQKKSEAALPQKKHIFSFPQASWVMSFPAAKIYEEGTQFHNFMLSYRRMHNYQRDYMAYGDADASLGALIATTGVDLGMNYCTDRYNANNEFLLEETGTIDEISGLWATNISNKWYVGLGVNMQLYSLDCAAEYVERFDKYNSKDEQYYNENNTVTFLSALTGTFSAGLIYRPTQWIRMGFSLHTASFGYSTIVTSGHYVANKDTLGISVAPDICRYLYDLHFPWRTSTSVALQLGKLGMLSLQYDYAHIKHVDDMHTLKVGIEAIPIPGMYINAGYAYESTFKSQIVPVPMDYTLERQDAHYLCPRSNHYASLALGFRGTNVIAQAAYQYRWQNTAIAAHENAVPYLFHTDTHRIVFTFAWHRAY